MLSIQTLKIEKSESNGLEKLVNLGLAFIDFSKKYPNHMNAILRLEGLDIKRTDFTLGDLRKFILYKSPVRMVLAYISQGIREEVIREDISPEVIAHTLWIQMLGVIQVVALKKSLFEIIDLTPEDLFKNHIELILNGIKR